MRVLFLGGTGIISTACTQLAVERGIELTLATRGRRNATLPPGTKQLVVDMHDEPAAHTALQGQSFDAVVDWIAYTPADIERDLRLFAGRTRQFVFISSASAYQKPALDYLITESTPLANPRWQYSRDKIACEERLLRAYREDGFPITIVRPSLTYGDSQVTLAVNSWEKSYTIIDRMRKGKRVIVPGDGTSLWVITHNTDFAKGLVGLLGHRQAIGHAFHITSEEARTWDQFYTMAAEAAGVNAKIVHIPSEFLSACVPDMYGSLLGDKALSTVFDNSKIRRFVPTFEATVPYAEGIRRTIAWFDADAARRVVDEAADATYDRLIDAYEYGTREAMARFNAR